MPCNEMAFIPTNFMLQNQHEDGRLPASLNPTLPSYTPQGIASFMGKRSVSFSGLDACEDMNGEDDLSDDCLQLGEKKRRLNIEQVKTLEKNFELGNKLEPERKIQLARALGLQPRQIAIWFQNRRARWKTKQLEKDYNQLKRQFEALKSDNDALHNRNKKLQAEILVLKDRRLPEPINLNKETEGSSSNRSENSSEVHLGISRTSAVDSPLSPHLMKPFMTSNRPTYLTQFLQTSSRSDLQSPKVEQPVQDESFCNLFCGSLEDQHGFWPWPEHHNFQ